MFNNIYNGKRVLVTGHTGFKGAWLVQWLTNLGAVVAGVSDDIPTNPNHFELLNLSEKIKDIRCDIRDEKAIQEVFATFKPEIIFHLAAQSLVKRSIDEPKLTFYTNVGGTINILEAIRKTPSVKATVMITSDKCYENVEWHYGYREDDKLGGKEPYSASKACAEIAVSAFQRTYWPNGEVMIATTRAGNVIGGGDWALDRIVPDCMRAWKNDEAVTLRSPDATRPWQHVLEPLSGYLWLGANLLKGNKNVNSEAFNFGPPADVNCSVEVLVKSLMKQWPGSNVICKEANSHEANLLKLCCDKALALLQWTPTLVLDETINMTAEWYTNYYLNGSTPYELTSQQIVLYQELAAKRGLIWAQ